MVIKLVSMKDFPPSVWHERKMQNITFEKYIKIPNENGAPVHGRYKNLSSVVQWTNFAPRRRFFHNGPQRKNGSFSFSKRGCRWLTLLLLYFYILCCTFMYRKVRCVGRNEKGMYICTITGKFCAKDRGRDLKTAKILFLALNYSCYVKCFSFWDFKQEFCITTYGMRYIASHGNGEITVRDMNIILPENEKIFFHSQCMGYIY